MSDRSAGLTRFIMAVADDPAVRRARFGVCVSCVAKHSIGLDRAVAEYGALSVEDRRRSGGLVDPQLVADTILRLAEDPDSRGRVVVLRAGRAPYAIDPAAGDPEHRSPPT